MKGRIMKKNFILCIVVILCLSCTPQESSTNRFPQLDKFYSDKPLGALIQNDSTYFRLFAPRANSVQLVLFEKHNAETGIHHPMQQDADGVWEFAKAGELYGSYYGYKVSGPQGKTEMFDSTIVIADPYSKAVVTQNNYHHPAKSLILNTEFDWQGDTWMTTPQEDLIIYEMHVRDISAHSSSGIEQAGTYLGVIETGKTGGMDYLLDLGVNAVELLPAHDFANIEIPFMDSTVSVYNTWNPYERNHWGYMTSYFFAPESYYSTGGTMERGKYNGVTGNQVLEFKSMVKELHKHNIAVLLDVVYNHVSQYDYNPFKYIDTKYYFRLNESNEFTSVSGCGNDFMTERPMARRLIIESVKYWMTEYHIDGFRFDLAYLIDNETCQEIIKEARKINPNVYIIAEPWGGGYDPAGFSRIGWAAWNDKFRNAVKGQNPFDNTGFIFGNWERENNPQTMTRYVSGTLASDGGLFQEPSHAINYLESHDDHTLGDFIRIGSGVVDAHDRIQDMIKHIKLTEKQLKLNKLAALFLFTSQGAVMLGQGQEFARSKVIAETNAPDPAQGQIDHNSYNKDNETNYINYYHKELNNELYQYYKGLIALRKMYPAFRKSHKSNISFLDCENEFGLGFHIQPKQKPSFIVMMNGHPTKHASFKLADGKWDLLTNEQQAGNEVIKAGITGHISVAPTTGMVFRTSF